MNEKISSIESLLNIFNDYVNEDDIISAQILSQISSRIVKYRLDRKMSQKEFAMFLDVSQTMVSKIESGDYNFTIKNLVKICNRMHLYLDVSIRNERTKTPKNKYIILNMDNNELNYEELPSKKKSILNDFSAIKKSIYNSKKWVR